VVGRGGRGPRSGKSSRPRSTFTDEPFRDESGHGHSLSFCARAAAVSAWVDSRCLWAIGRGGSRQRLTAKHLICSSEHGCVPHGFTTLCNSLTEAIQAVEAELTAMQAEHDPLASHIFVSRRHYRLRCAAETKGTFAPPPFGKCSENRVVGEVRLVLKRCAVMKLFAAPTPPRVG
jgi:hypothetical protein